MLYISLFLSAVLLVAANLAARYSKQPVHTTIAWSVVLAVLPCVVFSPTVMLQAAVLCGGLLLAGAFGRGARFITPLSLLSVVIAYGVTGYWAVQKHREYDDLRAQFPFESMEARLPRPVPPSPGGDAERLNRLEEAIHRDYQNGSREYHRTTGEFRTRTLRELHEGTVDVFVGSPGFGVGRMVRTASPEVVLKGKPGEAVPEQPQPDYFSPQLLSQPTGALSFPRVLSFGRLHVEGVLDFVNPGGFGYVKDRRHVAGFQSHRFSKVPGPAGEWKVASLELVGLLLHDDPVVYVSPRLPRMDELRDAPTRPPDAFEAAALAALRGGADLHLGDGSDGARFVGAIRATKQCVECHGCQRGDLLGAFTYRLRFEQK